MELGFAIEHRSVPFGEGEGGWGSATLTIVFASFTHQGNNFTLLKKSMQKFLFVVLSVITLNTTSFSQTQYEVLKDFDGGKILKGIISRDILATDTAFKWYNQNLKPYPAGKDAATLLRKNKDSVHLIVFIGTWCEDSHTIIPKLFPFLDAAGFSNDRVTLIGVDRNKKTISHLSEAFNLINVPTVIVMKDGKELGRVVEYGRYGMVEKEVAEIADKK